MSWINEGYRFPEIDKAATTYFVDADVPAPSTYAYVFDTLPQLRTLIKERLGDAVTDAQALELAKNAFRNKPRASSSSSCEGQREVVDFIYEM